MGVIAATSMAGLGVRAMSETTLTASDTLAYDAASSGSILILRNPTGGAISPTIIGSTAPASIPVSGYGTVSAAAGYPVGSIPAGAARVIPLDTIARYLSGAVTITGGTGLVAAFLK